MENVNTVRLKNYLHADWIQTQMTHGIYLKINQIHNPLHIHSSGRKIVLNPCSMWLNGLLRIKCIILALTFWYCVKIIHVVK